MPKSNLPLQLVARKDMCGRMNVCICGMTNVRRSSLQCKYLLVFIVSLLRDLYCSIILLLDTILSISHPVCWS